MLLGAERIAVGEFFLAHFDGRKVGGIMEDCQSLRNLSIPLNWSNLPSRSWRKNGGVVIFT